MQVEALVLVEPLAHIVVLVGGVIVQDDVDVCALGDLTVDQLQEHEELLVAMTGEALADHLTGGHVKCGEQRRGAVAFVVMGHRPGTALLHRQARLRAIQRRDL